MQIYNDEKKRVGVLSGFKERHITKTLASGEKELYFEYPSDGKMARLLKEEYYIRTKEDEFVLKEVETGKYYNCYTAVLNVEELEGCQFPYGFASKEQTLRDCLEFAFEGTGWRVGSCELKKKRTIDIEEAATAWDVLQSCLSTYRCECEIDSLNKVVNVYEQIGRDRGCYFMEGLNLRELACHSGTYEFYTRIIPIGKDGINIEWLHGKEYLENYQYSKKVKTYTWKDERYTNTTSLIEDAEAKLEEISKPYRSYSADVVDLAKFNPEYRGILDYGIGDTVHLVSKRQKVKEKLRIVKIVEYPEAPEKNTVELSNASKTLAEMQKMETDIAKTEAISVSNSKTKKILADSYLTKEETESRITASHEEITMQVAGSSSKWDTSGYERAIDFSGFGLPEDSGYASDEANAGKSYLNVENGDVYYCLETDDHSWIKVYECPVLAESMSAQINLNKEKISQKVDKGKVSSEISLEHDEVYIGTNRLRVESDNFTLTENSASFCGDVDAKTFQAEYNSETIHYEMKASAEGFEVGSSWNSSHVVINNNRIYSLIGTTPCSILALTGVGDSLLGSSLNIKGSLYVSGTKSRLAETKNYGNRLLYCYEMASPIFGDVGHGTIGEDGLCYVDIDIILKETVQNGNAYFVFLQSYSENMVFIKEKNPDYFVVSGKPGSGFDWEVKAKQKEYEYKRFESMEEQNEPDFDYVNAADAYLKNFEKELI